MTYPGWEVIPTMTIFKNKLDELKEKLKRDLFEEEWSRRMGFGRLEKARAMGRIQVYRNLLSYLGVGEEEVSLLFKQAENQVKEHQVYKEFFFGGKE